MITAKEMFKRRVGVIELQTTRKDSADRTMNDAANENVCQDEVKTTIEVIEKALDVYGSDWKYSDFPKGDNYKIFIGLPHSLEYRTVDVEVSEAGRVEYLALRTATNAQVAGYFRKLGYSVNTQLRRDRQRKNNYAFSTTISWHDD